MENSSRRQQNNDDLRKQSLIAWRLSPRLLPMFKSIIANADIPLEDIVKETGFTKPTAYERIYDFCILYETTVHDDNFPENLLVRLNLHH